MVFACCMVYRGVQRDAGDGGQPAHAGEVYDVPCTIRPYCAEHRHRVCARICVGVRERARVCAGVCAFACENHRFVCAPDGNFVQAVCHRIRVWRQREPCGRIRTAGAVLGHTLGSGSRPERDALEVDVELEVNFVSRRFLQAGDPSHTPRKMITTCACACLYTVRAQHASNVEKHI